MFVLQLFFCIRKMSELQAEDWKLEAQAVVLQFFSEYPAIGGHPLLLEWHGSAMISRIVWEFVKGFLERISRLLGSIRLSVCLSVRPSRASRSGASLGAT